MKREAKQISSEQVALALIAKMKAEVQRPKPDTEQAKLLARLGGLVKR